MVSFSTRLGSVLIALAAVAMPARADDVQEAGKLLKAGQHKQALEAVNKALRAKPKDPQARFMKGLILTEQGNSKEAIEIFTQLTKDYPELPEPYNNLAVIYASQGQYDKARAALEQSIRTHPSYATAYENLGDVYAKLASQAYDKALQIDSSNAAAKNKLSLVRELVGRPAAATVVAAAPKEPAKPAAVEKPQPAPEKSTPAADPQAEILKAVNAWAQAWSKKDADGYLSYYAKDFKTPGGEARDSWEKTRRQRVTAPKSISVSLSSPKVTMNGADRATVTFRQNYKSDVLKSNSSKTLVMVKSDGGWKILEEKSG
ncbi:MAG TPA: tetratricopeptide repeat protein [Burkholderiales bacterium]|jgi:tetratricopeptide (TPR) repeat protein